MLQSFVLLGTNNSVLYWKGKNFKTTNNKISPKYRMPSPPLMVYYVRIILAEHLQKQQWIPISPRGGGMLRGLGRITW
jgi:hypothetical protein